MPGVFLLLGILTTMKTVVILRGPAAVGKSTLAALLRERLGEYWAHVDVDRIKHMISPDSSADRTRIAHITAQHLVGLILEAGRGVIIEELFRASDYAALREGLKPLGVRIVSVFVTAPVEVAITNDQNRLTKTKGAAEIQRLHGLVTPLKDDVVVDTSKEELAGIADRLVTLI